MCDNSYSCHGTGVFLMGAVAGMAAGAALSAAIAPSSTRQIKRAAQQGRQTGRRGCGPPGRSHGHVNTRASLSGRTKSGRPSMASRFSAFQDPNVKNDLGSCCNNQIH